MLRFRQYLKEVRLSRLAGALAKGDPIGTVSPERGEMSKEQKYEAHGKIQKDLRRLSKKGLLSYSGTHDGRYNYAGANKPSAEGSYVVRPGKHPKAKGKFDKILMALGKRYGQESVLKIKRKGKKTEGAFHYTAGPKKGTVDIAGEMRYNRPLGKNEGDTALKAGGSFTVKK